VGVRRPGRVRATFTVPPDKSISHRALIFNAIASGTARLENVLDSADVRATAACLGALGVKIDWPPGSTGATIRGSQLQGLMEPHGPLDCGNSGTSIRLLAGLLAAQPFLSVLSGDQSLNARPMARVIEPLAKMGAHVLGRCRDTLPPIVLRGGALRGISHDAPVASAQVKTALMLASLYADGPTKLGEPSPSRDHSERMLGEMGVEIGHDVEGRLEVFPAERLDPLPVKVPGDFSSAAPWLVLGACHPDAEIRLIGVNINPTRTGLLDVMRAMGANVETSEERTVGGEPVADLVASSSDLVGIEVAGADIPRTIDELPFVGLLGAFADGATVVRDAEELRTKESDRVDATASVLGAMGVEMLAADDGFSVHGGKLKGGRVDAGGDHRIGMLAGVAGALADGETSVDNDAVGVSYPTFWRDLHAAGAGKAS